MRYLYLDNFRGFENTFIPIKDVNFLVGENSTGKSSVLALINLLGSFSFWLNQEFNDENVELGAFKDIVSAHSDNRSTFRVGVLECDVDSAFPSANQNTFLLTFEDQKGQPIVKRYNYINNDKQVEVIFSKQQIRYKLEDIASCDPLGKTLYTSFLGWTTGTEQTSTGYKILALDNVPFSNRGALAAVRFLINQLDLNSNHAQDKEFSFQISLPSFADRLSWIAPIRSKPQRTYDGYKQSFDPAGEHIPYLIKDMLSGEKKGGEFQRYIAKFGQESNLLRMSMLRIMINNILHHPLSWAYL